MPSKSMYSKEYFKKIICSEKFNWMFVILCVILGSIYIFMNVSKTTPLIDFTYQLENSYRITKGQIPYRDFFLVLTPGVYYLDALFLKIFGQSNIGQVVLMILMHSLIVLMTNRILYRICGYDIVLYLGTIVTACSEDVVYPFVNYNTLCYVLMLCSITYLLKHLDHNSAFRAVFMGILATLPFYAKQSYGLFYAIAFFLFYFYYCYKKRKMKFWLYSIVGSIVTNVAFVFFLIVNRISIYDFLYQTFIFPSAEKYTLNSMCHAVINAFSSTTAITYLYVLFLILLYELDTSGKKIKILISVALYVLMRYVIQYAMKSGYHEATIFWYLVYVVLAFIFIIEVLFKRELLSYESIIIVSLFLVIMGILTKRVDGPLWFFCIIVSLIYRYYREREFSLIVPIIMVFLLLGCIRLNSYVVMGYVDEVGELQEDTNITSKYYKIGVKGEWLEEIKNLANHIETKIGEKSFVEVPCEDPVYWATGTEPQLNFFQLFPQTCPYSKDQVAGIISKAGIDVIIVKRKCQFKYYTITEDDIDDFEEQVEQLGYVFIEQCGIYDIYAKKNN